MLFICRYCVYMGIYVCVFGVFVYACIYMYFSITCVHLSLLLQNGVDVNSWHRVLLRSVKPALHANIDCTALIAAVVCRQAPVVKCLLQVGS